MKTRGPWLRRISRVGAALGAALAVLVARAAAAQDFEPAAPSGPVGSPSVLIERALPLPADGARLELLAVRWGALADFSTRAAALEAGWGAARFAAGLSSTGDGEIGWNAVALAAGLASHLQGVGVRAIVRRDRSSPDPAASRAIGIESGAGFWSALGPRARVWVSVPGMLGAGESAPLDRGLESGVKCSAGVLHGWLAWTAPARAADAGERIAGAGYDTGSIAAWIEARDRPLRATLGLRVRRDALEIAASVSEHPLLGETTRLALIANRRARSLPERNGSP
jgi:hypothetical protein